MIAVTESPSANVTAPVAVTPPSIQLDAAAQEAGLGPILADLIRQNLEQHPERRTAFDRLRGTVAIDSTDADVAVTLDFLGGGLMVRGGGQGSRDLTISADSLTLLELTNANLRLGLPDPAHSSGRAVLGKLFSRRLKITGRGLVLRPLLLLRITKLLNVASG